MKLDKTVRPAAAACLFILVWLSAAQAHRVNVFCWTEAGKVACESSFPDGSPVSGARISVRSKQTGEALLTEQTDEQGRIGFPVPERAVENSWDLEVVLEASMGHQSSWTVRSEELAPGNPAGSMSQADTGSTGSQEPGPADGRNGLDDRQPRLAMSQEALRQIVSRAVAEELAPLKRQVQSLKQDRVSLQDVLGGLGYILGLMGLALYFKSRGATRE